MSHDDDLDQRLARAGAAWRADHPASEPQLPELRRRRAWVAPVAAAASVALLAGGVFAATRAGDPRTDAPPAGADGTRWDPDLPPGVVPADVPGAIPPVNQNVVYPSAELAGAFTPSLTDVEGKPACGARDVDFGLARGDGDGEIDFRLEAAGDDVACVLSRYPFQEYERDGEPVEVLVDSPDPRAGDWPAAVLVTPDRPAIMRTTWSGWCEAPPFDLVKMFFDDNSEERLEIAGAVTGCTGEPSSLPDRITTAGWEPETWSVDPPGDFSGLGASLVETVDGPSNIPTWVVELTSPRDLDLDTCPSWEVRQGDEESAAWRLNCEGVETKRPDGTPYLPAGTPVRFAIWVSYGGTDAALTWLLHTPDGPVTVPLSEGPEAPTGEPRVVVERDANLHVYVSAGFDSPTAISITIDGTAVFDEAVETGGQDAPTVVELAVPAGARQVVVESETGARRELVLEVPARGDRWVNLEVWDDPAQDGRGSIQWRVSEAPLAFG